MGMKFNPISQKFDMVVNDHTKLLNIGSNSHAVIDSHIADVTIHFTEASIDHGNILGLSDDDHSIYALLAGRSGGQTLIGDTASGGNLTLQSTAHATKGSIIAGDLTIENTAGATIVGNDNLLIGPPANTHATINFQPTTANYDTVFNFKKSDGTLVGDFLYDTSTSDMIFRNQVVGSSADMMFYTSNIERLRITGSGRAGLNTDTPGGQFHIKSLNATNIGQIIQGFSGQSANLQEWQKSDGTVYAKMDATGNIVPVQRLILPMGETNYFNTTGTAITISAQSDGSTNMVLVNPTTALSSGEYEFDNGGGNTGRLRYTGTTTKMFHIACTISFSPDNANDEFVVGVAKNGTVISTSKIISKARGIGETSTTALHVMAEMATNDYLELYVGNISGTGNFTIKTLTMFAMGL